MLPAEFVILGTIIGSIGTISYIIATIKGRVKPNRVSYLLWAIAPLVAFAAQLSQGVGLQSLLTFSVGFLPLLVFIASFVNKKAEWKLTRFDLICGVLSVLGFMMWAFTRVGNIAILFSIISDGLAAVPTIVKSYKYPQTETIWPWLASATSAMITLLTITTWTFEYYAFPLYIFLVCTLIFFLVKTEIGEK